MTTHTPTLAALLDRTVLDPDTGCLTFTGYRNPLGYGQVWHEGRAWLAHRLAYVLARDVDPADLAGLVVRHVVCRNRACLCPSHVRVGTHAENVADMMADGTHHEVAKTECKRGHPLVIGDPNCRVDRRGVRVCLACRRIRYRARHPLPAVVVAPEPEPAPIAPDSTGALFVSVAEAAERLGIGEADVVALVDARRLRAGRSGRRLLVVAADVGSHSREPSGCQT